MKIQIHHIVLKKTILNPNTSNIIKIHLKRINYWIFQGVMVLSLVIEIQDLIIQKIVNKLNQIKSFFES